jgi:hypothetical protein
MGRSETEVLIGRIVQRIRGYPVDYRGDLQAAVSICKLRILSFQFSVLGLGEIGFGVSETKALQPVFALGPFK